MINHVLKLALDDTVMALKKAEENLDVATLRHRTGFPSSVASATLIASARRSVSIALDLIALANAEEEKVY